MTTEDRSDDANLHPTTLEYYPGDAEIRREIVEYMRHYERKDLRQMRRTTSWTNTARPWPPA